MSVTKRVVSKAGLAMRIGAICAALLLVVPSSVCGTTTSADSWLIRQQEGLVQCVSPGPGAMTVQFSPSGSIPVSSQASLVPVSSDPSKSFAGNLAARQVSSVSFSLAGTGGQPSLSTRLQLRSGEYIWNRIGLNVEADGAGTASNTISFDLADGWDTWAPGQDKNALWNSALQSVDSLELVIVKQGIPTAQTNTVSVSGFALVDNSSGSALEQALRAAFGVSTVAEVTAAQAALDSNGDGMTDLVAILMEYSPGYFEQNFKLNAEVAQDGITITWPCVKGQSYMVYRSTNLMAADGGFAQASGQLDAQSTGYGSFTDVDIVDGVQYFYRVKRIGQ